MGAPGWQRPGATRSWCTSGLTGRGAIVIISITLFAPVHRGLRVRSNLRRRVGHLELLCNQESQRRAPATQVCTVPLSAEVLLTLARTGHILDCGGRFNRHHVADRETRIGLLPSRNSANCLFYHRTSPPHPSHSVYRERRDRPKYPSSCWRMPRARFCSGVKPVTFGQVTMYDAAAAPAFRAGRRSD